MSYSSRILRTEALLIWMPARTMCRAMLRVPKFFLGKACGSHGRFDGLSIVSDKLAVIVVCGTLATIEHVCWICMVTNMRDRFKQTRFNWQISTMSWCVKMLK